MSIFALFVFVPILFIVAVASIVLLAKFLSALQIIIVATVIVLLIVRKYAPRLVLVVERRRQAKEEKEKLPLAKVIRMPNRQV